jgi:tyrosine-protein phosphatase SIW14
MGLGVALVLAVLFVHYWPGVQGWATYFGYKTKFFNFGAPARYPLAAPRHDLPGLTNFAPVSRNLYRAAAADRAGFLGLKQMGLKTVVDLREAHSDLPDLRGLGLYYVHLPVNPAHVENEEVADFLHVVRDPDYQPFFVHCTAGSDRTGVMVAIYRVMEQNWPVDQAALELPRFGFHQIWAPVLRYLKTMDRRQINALAATRPLPPVVQVP